MGFSLYYTLAFMAFFGLSQAQWTTGSSLPYSLKIVHDDFDVQHGDAQNVKNGIQKQVQLKAKNNFDSNGLTYAFTPIPQIAIKPQVLSSSQTIKNQNQDESSNKISLQNKQQPLILSNTTQSQLTNSQKNPIINQYPLKQDQKLNNSKIKALKSTTKIDTSNVVKGTDHQVLGRNNYVEGYKDTIIGNSNKIIGSLQFVKGDGNYIQHHKHTQNELI